MKLEFRVPDQGHGSVRNFLGVAVRLALALHRSRLLARIAQVSGKDFKKRLDIS
jgi:hypothetical protein